MHKEIIVDVNDVTKAIGLINLAKSEGKLLDRYNLAEYDAIGCCGWAKAPRAWFISFTISDKAWTNALRLFVKNNVTLLPETTGY